MITLIRAAWQTEYRNPEFIGLSTDGYPLSTDPAVKNGARIYFMDTGETYEYSQEDDSWFEVPTGGGGGGASSWSELSDKPFDTIGEGLEVDTDKALNVKREVIDVGSNQYVYESYSLPAIPVENLRTIYANHKASVPQVIKWTLLGSETYLAVISADYIVGTYSVDVLVHNRYHCQYNWTDDSTGNINPEVASRIPASTTVDEGKFLRVGSDGKPAWETVPNAEDSTF